MATEADTARNQYEAYRHAYDNGHSEWVARAATQFNFWKGNQWSAADRARLERAGRPALTLNVVESLIRALGGMQCALRNDVRYLPTGDSATAASAKVMDAVWLYTQQQNDLDFLETDVYLKGLIMDRAYYDVRVNHTAGFAAEIQITSPRSQDIILDSSVDTYDPNTGNWPQVFKRRFWSYEDLKQEYGKDAADQIRYQPMPDWYAYEDSFMCQQMGGLPYYRGAMPSDESRIRGYLLNERQYAVWKKKDVFVDVTTGDISEIPESWDRNRVSMALQQFPELSTTRQTVRTIRWTVCSETTVLHDEDSPYRNYTIIPYFPVFIDGEAKGAVGSIIDPQEMFNKVSSQELHIINTTANSGWKVKVGTLKNMSVEELEEVGSRSGFVAEVTDMDGLEKIQPNQVPQGHDRLSFKADQIMRSLMGVSNQARGFAREDVAGEAILANQAAQDVNSALWMANLHRTKQMLARAVADCARDHYTDTRVIMINQGSAFRPQMESITLNQPTEEGTVLNDTTAGRYSTVLVPAPSRTTMSQEDFELLLKMRELGIGIPDDLLIELCPAANKGKIIENLQGDSNERQRQADEAAAQQQLIEQQKAVAQAQKEESAAMLNQARAEKAAIEARTEPDAAYREIEHARIGVDRERMMREFTLEERRLDQDKQFQSQDVALRLAEMDNDRQTKVEVARAKPAPKPAGKKSTPPKRKSTR